MNGKARVNGLSIARLIYPIADRAIGPFLQLLHNLAMQGVQIVKRDSLLRCPDLGLPAQLHNVRRRIVASDNSVEGHFDA